MDNEHGFHPQPEVRQTFGSQQVQQAQGFQSSTAARLRHSAILPPATPQSCGSAMAPQRAYVGYSPAGCPATRFNNPKFDAHGESGAFSRAHSVAGAQTKEPSGAHNHEHTFAVLRMTRLSCSTQPINQKAALMSLRMVCSEIGIDLPQKVKMLEYKPSCVSYKILESTIRAVIEENEITEIEVVDIDNESETSKNCDVRLTWVRLETFENTVNKESHAMATTLYFRMAHNWDDRMSTNTKLFTAALGNCGLSLVGSPLPANPTNSRGQ